MVFLFVFKFLIYCFFFIMIVGVMGGFEGLIVFINGLFSVKFIMFDKSIFFVNNFFFGVDCFFYYFFLIVVISIVILYVC